MNARRRVIALACALPLAVAACGEDKVETESSEERIADYFSAVGAPKPKSVDCPGDVEAKQGTSFACKITPAGGAQFDVAMKVGKVTDDQAEVAPVDVAKLGQQIAAAAARK